MDTSCVRGLSNDMVVIGGDTRDYLLSEVESLINVMNHNTDRIMKMLL